MGNDNSITKQENFLEDAEAKELFGQLDYLLKDGVHIQNRPEQAVFFQFIQRNEKNLKDYYETFFGVKLDFSGESTEKYYYLEFSPQSRGSIPLNHRHFMQNEFVIVGFLLYKIIFIDKNLELNSIAQFKKMLRLEYEELKPGVYRLLAKIQKKKPNQMDDDRVGNIIDNAMAEFNKIGWIILKDDYFDTLPAFQRIHKVYADYINHVEELFKEVNT